MSKIKINLASGAVLEKPLITCFKGTNGNYVVLDNEANGSMGLPIIIISKLNGTAFEKIIDPNEWGAVKDNLKTIIGGTALPYLAVPETVSAQDDFFTQLTLPVASYDLLKKVYAPAPAEPVAPEAPAAAPAPEAPVQTPAPAETPAAPVVPDPTPIVPTPVAVTPEPAAPVAPATPAAPVIEAPVINPEAPATPAAPAVPTETPAVPEAPAAPAAPDVPVAPDPTPAVPVPEPAPAPVAPPEIPVAPAPTPEAPAIDLPVTNEDNSANATDPDIALIKETFMKSCENMFEALIKKFNK